MYLIKYLLITKAKQIENVFDIIHYVIWNNESIY